MTFLGYTLGFGLPSCGVFSLSFAVGCFYIPWLVSPPCLSNPLNCIFVCLATLLGRGLLFGIPFFSFSVLRGLRCPTHFFPSSCYPVAMAVNPFFVLHADPEKESFSPLHLSSGVHLRLRCRGVSCLTSYRAFFPWPVLLAVNPVCTRFSVFPPLSCFYGLCAWLHTVLT